MLRLILGLLAIGTIKIIFNVGGSIVYFLSELIKIGLFILLIWGIAAAGEGNRLPIILIIGLPVAGIVYIIRYARNRINPKKHINKKEKKTVLDDSDFVEIIDSI